MKAGVVKWMVSLVIHRVGAFHLSKPQEDHSSAFEVHEGPKDAGILSVIFKPLVLGTEYEYSQDLEQDNWSESCCIVPLSYVTFQPTSA